MALQERRPHESATVLDTTDIQWAVFAKKVKALSGLDLYAYKPQQMRRRLRALMEKMGASDWVQFARILESRPQALKEFKDFLTINVSEFFRGADKFLQLRDEVIPGIVRPGRTLSIWSAGCSVGAEPYTLAMIIDSLRLASRARIMASDIDQTVIDRARDAATDTTIWK